MTEQSMVERVARAIFGHWRQKPRLSDEEIAKAWEALDPSFKPAWCDSARAAIEAMREPTREVTWALMLDAPSSYEVDVQSHLVVQQDVERRGRRRAG